MQSVASLLPVWAQALLAFVPAFAAIFAGIGLWLNAAQSRRTNAQARATLVAKCLERFTDNEDMPAIFYEIEYSRFKYNAATFHDSAEEKQLDKLLMHLSTAALAWEAGLLRREDLQPLQYIVRRTLRDPGVTEYLGFVAEWSSRANLGEHPYIALANLGRALDA